MYSYKNSFKTTWCITVLCLTLGFSILVYAKSLNDEICGGLKHGNGHKLNILAVGLRKNGLILITKDWMVYDLPKISMDSIRNRMYLFEPEEMKTKFPNLWNNNTFQQMKRDLRDGIVVISEKQELLCFVIHEPLVNLVYDLNSHTVSFGFYLDDRIELIFISTPELKRFHSTRKGTKGTQLNTWQLNTDNVIHEIGHYRSICWVKKSRKIIIKESNEGCGKNEPVHWPMMKGFVADYKFYLFDQSVIHVFPYNAWSDHKPSPKPVIDVKYSDFFWCSRNPAESTLLSWWIFLAIVILATLLPLVLIVAFVQISEIRKRRRRVKKSKKSASKHRPSSTKVKSSKKKPSHSKHSKKHRSQKSKNKPTVRVSKRRSRRRRNRILRRSVKKDNSSRFK